jgi:hypothetical protein
MVKNIFDEGVIMINFDRLRFSYEMARRMLFDDYNVFFIRLYDACNMMIFGILGIGDNQPFVHHRTDDEHIEL